MSPNNVILKKTFFIGICNICLLILHRFRPIILWGLIIICVPSVIFLMTYFLILWDGSINHKYIVNCSIHFMRNSLSFDLRITCLSMTREQGSLCGRINKWLIVKYHFPTSIPFKSKLHTVDSPQGPKQEIWDLQKQPFDVCKTKTQSFIWAPVMACLLNPALLTGNKCPNLYLGQNS